MDRRSELPSVAAARARRDLHLESALESNRTTPTDAGFRLGADHVGCSQKDLVLGELRSLTNRA